ncbi:MAG: translation elongation factor Ts [Eubacteriales bacterium]|nr:translation elongation factor Ts [Eubacteriales bacterium]MDD3883263.1 translation elongation factor Ts [Eubacteriales bacterium]MDD4513854.1 translation elongation factor Ts [Eubacteriales bacterium]
MVITAAMVKELRERTQAGMMDCKKALTAEDGDMDKAIEYLREKGLAAAAKKAGRIAAEGVVASCVEGSVGVLVEVNCETDFVANTDKFRDFAKNVAEHIAKVAPKDEAELMDQPFFADNSKTIKDLVSDATVSIGEKISIRRFVRYENANAAEEVYIHMMGKIGVLLEVEGCDDKALLHDIAMHIAAANPLFIDKSVVPSENLEKEKEILRAQALNEGKPEKIVDKMVIGRIEKYYKEVCLLEQPFVKDPDKAVKDLLPAGAVITRFARFERGEGIEKRVDNFAAEVMAEAGKL